MKSVGKKEKIVRFRLLQHVLSIRVGISCACICNIVPNFACFHQTYELNDKRCLFDFEANNNRERTSYMTFKRSNQTSELVKRNGKRATATTIEMMRVMGWDSFQIMCIWHVLYLFICKITYIIICHAASECSFHAVNKIFITLTLIHLVCIYSASEKFICLLLLFICRYNHK